MRITLPLVGYICDFGYIKTLNSLFFELIYSNELHGHVCVRLCATSPVISLSSRSYICFARLNDEVLLIPIPPAKFE